MTTNSKLKYPKGQEAVDMCAAIEQLKRDSRMEGRAEGKAEGRAEGEIKGSFSFLQLKAGRAGFTVIFLFDII